MVAIPNQNHHAPVGYNIGRYAGEVDPQWGDFYRDLTLMSIVDDSIFDVIGNEVGTKGAEVTLTTGVAGKAMNHPGDTGGNDDTGYRWVDHARFDASTAITIGVLVEVNDWEAAAMGDFAHMVAKAPWSGNEKAFRARVEGASLFWEISNDGASPGAGNRASVATSTLDVGRDNTAQLIVFTYDLNDSNLLKIYLDGVEVASATGETGPIYDTAEPFCIGDSSDAGDAQERDQWLGKTFGVWYWKDRALSADEVYRWFEAGAWTPFTRRLPSFGGIAVAAAAAGIAPTLINGGLVNQPGLVNGGLVRV